jgi:hypothetical protein
LFSKGDGRFYRPYRGNPVTPSPDVDTALQALPVTAVNVTLDSSVAEKWLAQADYRPPTLLNAGIAPTQAAR